MKLPKDVADTPYEVLAFRVTHFHAEDNEELAPSVQIEVAGRLPGTEAEVMVPFEMPPETALQLADELLHQYRCLVHGLPEDEGEDDIEEEEP
jgi:hypothetical protein